MPKRVVDGEGLWRSDKLGRLEPVWARPEYANVLPLALANGSFECTPQRVWSIVYSFNRPDVSIDKVETLLRVFEDVGLLFRWISPDGKRWGYFTGIDKPGRLPGRSRKGRNEKLGAEPPQEELRKFLESKTFPGFCLGSCSGSGSGENPCAAPQAPEARSPESRAMFVVNEPPAQPRAGQSNETRQSTLRTAVEVDPRYQPFLDHAVETFKVQYGQAPTWCRRDFRALRGLLQRRRDLPLAELRRRWMNYLGSTERFVTNQGAALWFFGSNFDRFIQGPQMATPKRVGGATNGKLRGKELLDHNLTVTGLKHPLDS